MSVRDRFMTLLPSGLLLGGFVLGCATTTDMSREDVLGGGPLGGTSWRLVEFEGGDGAVLMPDDREKYTIVFETDGRVSVRVDCNRGSGPWRSDGPNHLMFGPLALTRAMCPSGSMHDQIVRNWEYVRSYALEGGHLFLSLMADGGIYEYEPMPSGTD